MEEALDLRTNGGFDWAKTPINEYLANLCSHVAFLKVDTLPYQKVVGSDTTEDLERIFAPIVSKITSWFKSDLALERLEEVYKECSMEDWDSYDAAAISQEAYLEARRLLRLIPSSFPMPDILPEPEGEIGLEWYKESGFSFVISVGGNNIITYAGRFGKNNETYGTEYFTDSMPKIILDSLRRLFPQSNE